MLDVCVYYVLIADAEVHLGVCHECDQCTNRIKSTNLVPITNRIIFDKLFLLAKISHETWGVLRSCLNDRRSATSQGRYQGEDG